MITAAQVAAAFKVSEVTINYRASKVLNQFLYKDDPMPQIELAKCDFAFRRLQDQNPKYFPAEGIVFKESESAPVNSEAGSSAGTALNDPNNNYKAELFQAFPESILNIEKRHLSIFEHAHRIFEAEGGGSKQDVNGRVLEQTPDKNICYLLITHGSFVDEIANILNYWEDDSQWVPPPGMVDEKERPTPHACTKDMRKKLFQVRPKAFANLDENQRKKMMKFLQVQHQSFMEVPYGHPGHCSITAFAMEGDEIETVLNRYSGHADGDEEEVVQADHSQAHADDAKAQEPVE